MKRDELNKIVASLLFHLALNGDAGMAAVLRRGDGRITGLSTVEKVVLRLLPPESAAVRVQLVLLDINHFDPSFGVWITRAGSVFFRKLGTLNEQEFDLLDFMPRNQLNEIVGEAVTG